MHISNLLMRMSMRKKYSKYQIEINLHNNNIIQSINQIFIVLLRQFCGILNLQSSLSRHFQVIQNPVTFLFSPVSKTLCSAIVAITSFMDDLCNVVVAVLTTNGSLTIHKLSRQQEELEHLSTLELGKQHPSYNPNVYPLMTLSY